MGKPGDQAPEIPGFQPLHIRGAGRLGIWIEARQVRLDRRVLLKVLPAAEYDLQQEFIREVQALVQLDGSGALRVIDEGEVGRARYVALDEGDAITLTEPPQELEQKLELGRCLIDLYQRLSRLQIVAGPIPASAIRILPSGGFVVAELGTVLEGGAEHEIRQRAAQTLEQIGSTFCIASPWTDAIKVLRSDADGFRRAREVIDQHVPGVAKFRSRMVLLIGVIAIVCAGIFWARWWRESEHGSGADDATEVVSSVGDDAQQSNTAVGQNSDDGDEGNPDQEKLVDTNAANREELARIRFEQHAKFQQLDSTWQIWAPLRDQILTHLETGDLAATRQKIADLPAQLEGSDGAESVTSEKAALIRAWSWIEQRKIALAQTQIKSATGRDKYDEAVAVLKSASRELGMEQHYSSEVKRLERLGQLYSETRKRMEQRMEQALVALPQFSTDELSEAEGLASFPRLKQRWLSFSSSCGEVQAVARTMISAVEDRVATDKAHQWKLRDGDPFEARATAVDEKSVSLRRVGRRNAELHSWSTIAEETLLQLANETGNISPDENQLFSRLRIIWGGSGSILKISRDPSVDEEIFLTADRLRKQQIGSWLEDGLEAQRREDLELLRTRAIEIASWIDEIQRPQLEEQLLEWWSAASHQEGPSSIGLFPQAVVSEWNPETGGIQIQWQGNEAGLAGWKSITGSSISRRGEFVLVQGRIYLDSPFRFSTSLEVRITGLVTREDAPNLNVVLWDGAPEALLFGIGIRPPEISSIRVGEVDVLLPAHMIIEEQIFAEGGGDIPMPAPRPKVLPGKAARLLVGEDEMGAQLKVDGALILRTEAREGQRIGGVAIETFGVPVVIRQVIIRGRIMQQDWHELLHQKAQEALWQHR